MARTRWFAVALCALLASAAAACSDVGDSSAVPGDSGPPDAGDVTAPPLMDGGQAGEGSAPQPDSAALPDSTPAVVDGASDTDSGETDSGETDTGALDSGVLDSGADAGGQDSGGEDAGMDATSTNDASADSGSQADSGGDAGVDAADGGSALVPCTTKGQTGCVQCQANDGENGTLPNVDKVCTPTEAALVAHDIGAGLATAPGADPDGSCYACAVGAGCLDDSQYNDLGHECEDLAGATNTGECQATLACILQSSCSATDVTTCYCGTAPVSGTCAAVGASNTANGVCKAAESTGLGLAANDGLDILKNFTSTTLPAGVANNIFQCALSNSCTACLH